MWYSDSEYIVTNTQIEITKMTDIELEYLINTNREILEDKYYNDTICKTVWYLILNAVNEQCYRESISDANDFEDSLQ
jgi:hypothetical protein